MEEGDRGLKIPVSERGFDLNDSEKSGRKGPTILIMIIGVTAVTVGDLFMSHAMKKLGPLEVPSVVAWWGGEGNLAEVGAEIYQLLWRIFSQPLVWVAIGFMLTFLVFWMVALSWSDLTFVMPLTALTYVLNAILVGPFLGETVSPIRWLGTLLIAGGVALVGAEPEKPPEKVET